MIASMTYPNYTDINGPTAADTDIGCVVYYDVEYDTSANEFYIDMDDLALLLMQFDREEMREKAAIARDPWPLPDPPMLRPCRIVNRMMRCNQLGRKTVVV